MKQKASSLLLTDLPKLIKLSRGLLGTMRLLKSRGASECSSTGELLAMQRFFREFGEWLNELDHRERTKNELRFRLRERHQKKLEAKRHAQGPGNRLPQR